MGCLTSHEVTARGAIHRHDAVESTRDGNDKRYLGDGERGWRGRSVLGYLEQLFTIKVPDENVYFYRHPFDMTSLDQTL